MNIKEIKDNISIIDFLQKIGIEPIKLRSGEHWYLSPIRDSDTDASFSVNDKIGKWYDHGEGIGGNIIDLGIRVFNPNGAGQVAQVVRKINELYGDNYKYEHKQIKVVKVKEKAHELILVKDIENNEALTNYISSRGVLSAARRIGLLKEVYYDFIQKEETKRRYFGVGWENVSGGYDVRSKYGKICIDKKDLLYREGITDKVMIFEGMFDALTAIELNADLINNHLIVLNSLSLLNRAVELVESKADLIKATDLYLDHGKGGRKGTSEFKSRLLNVVDKSYLYIGFDDYNDKLVYNLLKRSESIERRREIRR